MANIKEIRTLPPKIKEIKKEKKDESELEKELEVEESNQFSNFMAGGEMVSPVLRMTGERQETAQIPQERTTAMGERNIQPYENRTITMNSPAQRVQMGSTSIPILRPSRDMAQSTNTNPNAFRRWDPVERDESYEPKAIESRETERKRMPWE